MRDVYSAAARGKSASVARGALAAWLFGNVYEGAVGLPQLLAYARGNRPTGLLAVGSPVRYFAPLAPFALLSLGSSFMRDWGTGKDRPVVVIRAASLLGALTLSGYLIRFVNVPLLTHGPPLTRLQLARLSRRWHRFNAVRVFLVGIALALQPTR